jgi:lipopolysaccharide export system protein LptA
LKWLFEGAQGLQQGENSLLVTDGKLQTWNEDGTLAFTLETPECLYDRTKQAISSPGRMQARIGENRFAIEGEGFYWQQTNANVVISNHVHSTVQLEAGKGKDRTITAEEGKMEIYSDHFTYATNSGLAVYDGNARVEGSKLNMLSGTLEVLLPGDTHEVHQITARKDVQVDYDSVQCSGQELVYTPGTGLLHVTGQPTWSAQGRKGGADDLLVERQAETLKATGQAWLRLPAQGFGEAGFVPGKRDTGPADTKPSDTEVTNQFVDIHSAEYELQTNMAVFTHSVSVEQTKDGKMQSAMTCERLEAQFSNAGITNKTSALEELFAFGDVVIRQGAEQELRAGRALYSAATKMLLLTDNPSWKDGPRNGGGNQIMLDGSRGEMTITGDTELRSPSAEFGSVTGATVPDARLVQSDAPTSQVAVLHSDKQVFRRDSGLVSGHVRLEHPRMTLTCERMTLPPAGAAEATRKVVAEGAIQFDASDERDQKIHGEGTSVDYDFGGSGVGRTEVVTLHGQPARMTSGSSLVENSLVILDRAHNKVFVPGRYVLRGSPGSAGTNTIPSLRLK